MWKVIQGLNGTPDANSPNKAMSHNGRTIIDIKYKAKIFINHNAQRQGQQTQNVTIQPWHQPTVQEKY